ncbi:MAG: lipopolysaccharide biosynthesis protein [Solirubrobacterales bacterium]
MSAAEAKPGAKTADYGRGAALLTVGIGVTGLVTFAYLSLASHSLSREQYGQIGLLWSAVFLITPIFYRPIEQLMARTIAERRARDQELLGPLKIAAAIQVALGVAFAVLALAFKGRLVEHLFHGNETLYWIMFASVLAYAVSYFGRGLLAGNQRFGLYGLLVLIESLVRFVFPLVVVLGIADGQDMIALGILAGPVVSLFVVPLALLGRKQAAQDSALDPRSPDEIVADVLEEETILDAAAGGGNIERADFTLAKGGGFALAALVIMACEQTILNAATFATNRTAGGAFAVAAVINILVIARAPMQLFQSVATSLLPHLSKLHADDDFKTYRHSVRLTLAAIAGFAGVSALVMLAVGPKLMQIVFGDKYVFERAELVAITVGMGIYLCGATLNQTALAAKKTGIAVVCWLAATGFFLIWEFAGFVEDPIERVAIGYPAAAAILFVSLFVLYEAVTPKAAAAID